MKKIIVTIFCLIIVSNFIYCQISIGGIPKSFNIKLLKDSIYTIKMPKLNIDSLIQNDTVNDFSFRFGYAIDVNIGLHNSGTWDTLQNGDKIWRLKIYSSDAYSINLIFDEFWLPDSAQFFVYSEDKSMVLGAFISYVSNNPYNKFATDLVKGNTIILEYDEPVYANGSKINIDKVIHGYINTFKRTGPGQSGSCNIDINCPQGDSWCKEKRAVSMILVDDNTRWCSGCLINNIREDLTPFYLTANHCLRGDEHTWIFRFKYWSPTCNQGDTATNWISITGSNIRANYAASDFALLELSSPPLGYGVFYAGWDRTASTPLSGTGIHHPSGDLMKISNDFNSLISVPWFTGASNHWRAIFNEGIVQHGSSGSPLFDQNHNVIGQLHGDQNNQCDIGDNTCFCSQLPIGEYGRFDISWDGGGTPQTRLRDWLDPDNTGATLVGPTSPTIYLFNRTLTGIHKFAALNDIHIEGNVSTYNLSFPFCPTSNIPFTAEPGSNVIIKAKEINIYPETEFKEGSNVTLIATNDINCNDNIIEGDYLFCIINNLKLNALNNLNYENNIETIQYNNNKKIYDNSENIIIYPNPNSGNFNIEFINKNYNFYTIIIYDLTGKIIYEKNNVFQNTINIDISQYTNGTYFIKIINQKDIYIKKIIKQ